ncbi:DUF7563 family protein [Haloterrigena salifodinae]|uniref:DUF7563 family protein n=1 Tax=Haloterrigena salifodinae TaxID=2675099 RepID=UPI0013DE9AC2|nr:hypothetical protein [Haloterrigena salifodinae]
MPRCGNCDAYVTSDFIRVFGVNDKVHGCPNCSTYRELSGGNGAVREPETEREVGELHV